MKIYSNAELQKNSKMQVLQIITEATTVKEMIWFFSLARAGRGTLQI